MCLVGLARVVGALCAYLTQTYIIDYWSLIIENSYRF